MNILSIIVGIIIGVLGTYVFLRFSKVSGAGVSFLEKQNEQLTTELQTERQKLMELTGIYSSLQSDFKNLQQKLAEQKDDVEKLQQQFASEFKNLANEILEDKSKRFTELNKENMDVVLKPLQEKIKDFEKKVEDTYSNESRQRTMLQKEIQMLYDLNQVMSKEANNLTNALKGQVKTQGNWGEMILESILEKSGLVKDREYFLQESITTEEGRRLQPDVVIKLPDSKTVVIDSKVSLTAYEVYCSAEDDNTRRLALAEHIQSIRNHIKNLSSKNYQNLYEVQGLDFVLLFVPIEPAFSLAVQNEIGLWNEAFEKNIVIVSTSTLLATLRTIAGIWRQENYNRNAQEIARQSGNLYDKFVGFTNDLIEVGRKMDSAKLSYEEAMKKLTSGNANLVKSAEKIKALGATTSKSIPAQLLDRAEAD
jgi:DNA recombination protein RmuC